MINCPICNKECKKLFVHIKKCFDKEHQQYLKELNDKIIGFFDKETTTADVATEVGVSKNYVLTVWKTLPNFKIKKEKIKILSNKRSTISRKNGFRISQNIIDKIIGYFNTSLSIVKIAKIVKVDERTVNRVFKKKFGIMAKKRNEKIGKLYRSLPSKRVIPEKVRHMVAGKFFEETSLRDVGQELNIAPATVAKIWKEYFGLKSYNKRKRTVSMVIQKKRADVAKEIGSKAEILCYNLIKELLICKVIHHDYSICPPYEIDITIPDLKIAINWDGPSHRRKIYSSSLEVIKQRDIYKNKVLLGKGWKHIVVIDDGKFDIDFVKSKVKEIIGLLTLQFEKIEI